MKSGNDYKLINVLVSGLGWSGSGTVVGLLNEYDTVLQIPGGPIEIAPAGYKKYGEFDYFRSRGMIGDYLIGNDKYYNVKTVLKILKKKSLQNKYISLINSPSLTKKDGFNSTLKMYKNINRTNKTLVHLIEKMNKTNDLTERMNLSREWLSEVLLSYGGNKKKVVVFDQAIHYSQHINIWQDFFKPCKLIIVYRDPRDILAEMERLNALFRQQMNSCIVDIYGADIDGSIKFIIDFLTTRIKTIDKLLEEDRGMNILAISFEDLVLNYERSKYKIEKFLNLDSKDHKYKNQQFDPSWSIKNMGVYKNSKIDFEREDFQYLMNWYNKMKTYKTYEKI